MKSDWDPRPKLRAVTANETTVPWDRQPGETAKAYAAFCAYRDLGTNRSLRRLAARDSEASTNVRQLARWSSAWDWPERAVAFDGFQDREWRLEQAEARKTMLRTHAAVARQGIAKAAEQIRELDPKNLTVREAIALFEVCVRVERASRGETSGLEEPGSLSVLGRPVPSGGQLLAALRTNPKLLEFADAVADVVQLPDFPIGDTGEFGPHLVHDQSSETRQDDGDGR